MELQAITAENFKKKGETLMFHLFKNEGGYTKKNLYLQAAFGELLRVEQFL